MTEAPSSSQRAQGNKRIIVISLLISLCKNKSFVAVVIVAVAVTITGTTLEYRINGGVGIIGGGLEMVRYGNNRGGWNNRGGCLEK